MSPRPFLAGLALLLVTQASAREWLITYAATEQQIIESPKGDAPPKTETRTYTETIALADHTVTTQDDRQKTIRDFSRRRFTVLNLARNTSDEWSLYSLPSTFEAELLNRNALGAGMRAAKVEQAAAQFDRFDNETALHVESPEHPLNPAKPVIESVKVEGGREFRHRGKTVVRVVPSSTALPAEFRHRFVNYLAYSCAIHPEIRHALAESEFVPQELVFTWRAINKVTTTILRLVSAKPADTDSTALPANAKPAAHEGDAIFELIATVRDAERSGRRPTRRDAVEFAESALAAGRPLDALMALLEHGLQSGEQLSDELRKHRKTFDADATCQTYLKAFDQSSKAACEANLAVNATIDRTGLKRAHMLELQRANHLDRLGKSAEARESYLKVIRANPFHAGALHDLGMLLARNYEHPKAWLCWDTARRLYPDHRMMKDITTREQQLLSRYPEFF